MKALVVYNPISGARGLRLRRSQVETILQKRNVEYEWLETKPKIEQTLQNYETWQGDCIIAIGGDGTVREVAAFILRHKKNIPLIIVPQGSANVVAAALGIPLTPRRALRFGLIHKSQAIDVMHINRKQYALIAAGKGYDSVLMLNASRTIKRKIGIFAYLVSFVRTFFTYRNRPYRLVVDGKKYFTAGKAAVVFNMISLSGLPLDKRVSPTDGVLDLVVISPKSLLDIAVMAGHTLLLRPMHRIPKIQTFRGKQISIQQPRDTAIQIDGDVCHGKQLTVELLPGALQIVARQ